MKSRSEGLGTAKRPVCARDGRLFLGPRNAPNDRMVRHDAKRLNVGALSDGHGQVPTGIRTPAKRTKTAVPNRPSDATLELLVVEALRAHPRGTEPLAADLARRPADVRRVCRALAAAGRIGRDGRVWRVLQPVARCTGTNGAGERCGREAALGSVFCTLHQDQSEPAPTTQVEEPKPRKPMPAYHARNLLSFLAVMAGRLLPENSGVTIPVCPQMRAEVHLECLGHESVARERLQSIDPEWLARHDANELTVRERMNSTRGFLELEARLREPRQKKSKVEPAPANTAPSGNTNIVEDDEWEFI